MLGLALLLAGCGSKFSGSEGGSTGGTGGVTPGAMGAAEIRLSPPAQSVPNIGTRTSCTAGSTGTYTYFLGSTPEGTTPEERVVGAMLPNGRVLRTECSLVEAAGSLFVSANVSGPDANSRRTPEVQLALAGEVVATSTFGDLESGSVKTTDTGELSADPFVASCVLSNIERPAPGSLVATFGCPALVGGDDVSGCYASGTISLSGCSR